MRRLAVSPGLDRLNQPAPGVENGGHESRWEEPVLDDTRRGVEKVGEGSRVIERARVVGDDASSGVSLARPDADRAETRQSGIREAERHELERHRRVECRQASSRLSRRNDRPRWRQASCMGGAAAYESAVLGDLVSSIDRQIEVAQRRKRLHLKAKCLSGDGSAGRGGNATKRQMPSGERCSRKATVDPVPSPSVMSSSTSSAAASAAACFSSSTSTTVVSHRRSKLPHT